MPLKRDSAKKYTSNPISGMGDLFGEPELPAGFRYIPDVISTADEKSLVQRFEKLPLKIFNPQTAPAAIIRSRSADEAAEKLAIELVRSPVRDPAEIESAITRLRRQTDGFIMLPDTFLNIHRKTIVELASRYQLPAIYPSSYLVAEGGLASYGIDLADSFRQAAVYVDRIFHGEKPADLPVQQPTKFDLAINLKTAKALGLAVPPALLARVDEVVE